MSDLTLITGCMQWSDLNGRLWMFLVFLCFLTGFFFFLLIVRIFVDLSHGPQVFSKVRGLSFSVTWYFCTCSQMSTTKMHCRDYVQRCTCTNVELKNRRHHMTSLFQKLYLFPHLSDETVQRDEVLNAEHEQGQEENNRPFRLHQREESSWSQSAWYD